MLVTRLDTTGIIKSYRETTEGFLDVHLTFSKCGALTYQRADGSFEDEHLTEADLFDEDSLATITGKPICYLHPNEWVNKDNVRKYARGSTGTKIIKDTPFATIVAAIHDGELIDIIKSGKAKQVSAGYVARTVRGDDGKLYQKGRVYNHLAIVPLGRAGSDVKVHFDNLDINKDRDMAVQVTTHADEMAILVTAESESRDRYIARMRRDSSRSVPDPAQSNGSQQVVITAGNSDADPLPDDGRKAYLERLKNPKR